MWRKNQEVIKDKSVAAQSGDGVFAGQSERG
jgi:hypothetical protein